MTTVTSADGVRLAVYESGAPGAPTVVAVHGFPDNHSVWNGVAAELAGEFHVVTYDVRGAGASDKPAAVRAYRMPRLVDDLVAVLDAVSPDRQVHLLGHDWGSIQAWPAVTDARLAGRVDSFTSISGPSLDYSGAWLRRSHQHPVAALRQLAHSSYIALFQLPKVPELAIRRGLLERGLARATTRTDSAHAHPAGRPRPAGDMLHGLALYRANMLGRVSRPRPVPAGLPVQLVVPERDAFVTPELAVAAPRPWVADLTVRRVAGGHWVVTERPELVADLVRDFVRARESAPATPPDD